MDLSTIATVDLMVRYTLPLRAEGVSDGALGDALGVVNVYETSEEIDGPFPLIGVATSVLAVSYHRFRQKGRVDGKLRKDRGATR